ncbi:hypothetical protein FJY94_02935 [Candidatus Kaiserbacteria bacterium]|nr:hypothetical protein [Candidatus Kaiserbacteria bacterium]
MKNGVKIFWGVIIAVIIISIGASFVMGRTAQPGALDGFAQCLADKQAVFYGAFWCPHCQAQKRLFGTSVKLLPYVECSTPDGKGQTAVCIEKKVESYPTWVFANGETYTGERTLAQLASSTGCVMPQ